MLSEIEKNAIENMVRNGLANSTITKKLKKNTKEVRDYIQSVSPASGLNPLVKSGAMARLSKAGLVGNDAEDLLNRTLRRFEDVSSISVEELYDACIINIGARELIKNKTDLGNEGVAIMTGEAAGLEQSKSNDSQYSRKARPMIYRPKDGKMASEE